MSAAKRLAKELRISRALNDRPRVLGLDPFVFWALLGLVAISAVSGSVRGLLGALGLGMVLHLFQPILEGEDSRRVEVLARSLVRARGSYFRPARSAFGSAGSRRVR